MSKKKIVYIFWTGGWDSTYRMVELSRQDITVHPIYCIDPKRKSNAIELKHMEDILELLRKKPDTKAEFMPIEKIDISKLQIDEEIKNAYKRVSQEIRLGSQYVWLAEIAKQYPGIELGLERPNGEFGGGTATINRFSKLIQHNGTFALDKAHTTDACYKIFGNMTFPIFYKTEVQMLQNIRDWGYEDVMKHIWFCHAPMKEKGQWQPCGFCRPCQQKMECNMEFLLDKSAQRRYKIYHFVSKVMGTRIASKIMKILFSKGK